MDAPTLVMGGAGSLLAMDAEGVYTDDGTEYELVARTNRIAPNGIGGECIFTTVFVAVTFRAPFSIRVTPVLDGIPDYTQSAEISNAQTLAERQTHLFEIGFSQEYTDSGGRKRRRFYRGTWWQVEFGMPCPPEMQDEFIIEGVDVEFEGVS